MSVRIADIDLRRPTLTAGFRVCLTVPYRLTSTAGRQNILIFSAATGASARLANGPTRLESTYESGKVVQKSGATPVLCQESQADVDKAVGVENSLRADFSPGIGPVVQSLRSTFVSGVLGTYLFAQWVNWGLTAYEPIGVGAWTNWKGRLTK